jgi:FAD/FMN-containing dehydrogenase
MRYPEMFMPEEEGYRPIGVVRTMFLDRFGPSEATTVVEQLASSTAMMRVAQIRVLGGAVSRVPNDATAYAHRDRPIMVNTAALVQDVDEVAEQDLWVERFMAALRGDTRGAYVNFLGDEGDGRIREAYPGPTWDRLEQIKARYDPDNVFRHNQNVAPAASG